MQSRQTPRRGGLGTVDLMMMGFGNIIGAGLFVASGVAVKQAGPAVVLAFVIGAVAFYGVVTALAEMATANPAPGGLRSFAREALGPWMGFTVGWMYWTSGVLTMSSEVTAAALLAHLWLPNVPLWTLSLAFSLLITGINFLDARGFGRVEGGLAVGKVLALAGFILIGGYFLARGSGVPLQDLQGPGAGLGRLFPTGLRGFASSLLMVMVTYAGVQIVGMAAPDTHDPVRTIPHAIRGLTASVILLYLGAFSVLVLLLPWRQIQTGSSPFVQALGRLGLPGAQGVLNLVVLTAALSALNATLYGVSRMLRSLARDGEAPAIFRGSTRTGTPGWALAGSSMMLAVGVVLSYLLPHRAYLMITSASGFIAMFNWTVIALCYLRYHPKLVRQHGERLVYRAPGYPYLPLVTMGITAGVMLTTPLNPGQTVGMVVGTAQFALVSAVYYVLIMPRKRVADEAEGVVIEYAPPEPVEPDDRLRT
ncbi:MAG TPA: amino acid permease [Symbiobacteriaceae bacterium]